MAINCKDNFYDRYDEWNNLKKSLLNRSNSPFCRTKEIWWCSIGMNVGVEMYGKNELFERPVLIIKVYNIESILTVPLTSTTKNGEFYASVPLDSVISTAILSQVRMLSTKRLSRKVGTIHDSDFKSIKEKLLRSIDI